MRNILLIVLLFFTACKPKEQPIEYGHDECKYCKMMIVDSRYGTEIVTKKGKAYKFDSVECLLDYLQNDTLIDVELVKFVLVTPFDKPGEFLGVEKACFLHSKKLPSPMGMYLTAFTNKDAAMAAKEQYGGSVLDWNTLYKTFNTLKQKTYSE